MVTHESSLSRASGGNGAHLAAIIDLAHDAVISRDLGGTISYWNRGAETLLGYGAREVIGRSASLLIPQAFAEEEHNLLERLKRGDSICQHPAVRIHQNGSLLNVSITLLPIRDEQGRLRGLSEIIHSMTARRKHIEDRQLLAAIVDSSHDAIISKDLCGMITSWNAGAENLFKYTAQEAVGRPITMIIPADRQSEEVTILNCLKRGERIDQYETVRVAKDGRLLNISLTVSPIKDKDGTIIGASKIARDITGQKQLACALQAAQKQLQSHIENLEKQVEERTSKLQQAVSELESFAYSISHDMRAPLRSMQSFAYFLKEDYSDQLAPEGIEYLDRIIKAASRMDCLIRNVLTFSQVGRADLPLEVVDVEELLHGLIQSYPQFQPPCVDIRVEGRLPCVLGNEASLTQCFTNLLSNAVKFIGPGVFPQVKIRAERREDRVRFWFEDNGIGIAPEFQEKIFGIFQRLSSQYEGTGMGLAIVQRAAKRMSGQVGVESHLGQGSRFWLEVALADPGSE